MVACRMPSPGLLPLCSATKEDPAVMTLGGLQATVPGVQAQAQVSHQPSYARHERPRLAVPTTDYRLSAADPVHVGRQLPTDMLVAPSCPSFPDPNSAWRAFFEGDFSLAGAQTPPNDLAMLSVRRHCG